jgi:hypothetical protein
MLCASIPDADADFVEVREHVGHVLVNTIGADPFELFFSVAAGKHANPQISGSPGREKIPHAISHDHGIGYPCSSRRTWEATAHAVLGTPPRHRKSQCVLTTRSSPD